MCGKLVLEDGSSFEGKSFGSDRAVAGELVFNTGMMGYPEALTDPSYRGQILVLTYPLVGNYGVPDDRLDKLGLLKNFESSGIQVNGLIIQGYTDEYSHHSAKRSLSQWLKEHDIPALHGIDTRSLTKRLRSKGVMLAKILHNEHIDFFDPNAQNLVDQVSITEPARYGSGSKKIVLIDCGVKNNIIVSLVERGAQVLRVPWDYDFLDEEFDALMISNGPGDPKMCRRTINNVRRVFGKKPVFGICLGNQIVALAAGAETYKLKFGHRSQNQPCIDRRTNRCYITSQNHGFAVDSKSLPDGWSEWFINANDNSNEGIIHKSGLIQTVQFHPEATPGPYDTSYLFDEFMERI